MVAALNGDVDNHADLKVEHRLRIETPISTDAKVIPVLMARSPVRATCDNVDAFRRTVTQFDGSVAIGATAHDASRHAPARPSRQRAGALRRPRRRLLHRGQ